MTVPLSIALSIKAIYWEFTIPNKLNKNYSIKKYRLLTIIYTGLKNFAIISIK